MTAANILIDKLLRQSVRAPKSPAISDAAGGTLTREALLRRVQQMAAGLRSSGLQSGDRVLFAVRPDAEALVIMLAVVSAGGVLVPLDPSMGDALFESRMARLAPRWVIAESVLYTIGGTPWLRRLARKFGVRIPAIKAIGGAEFVHVGRRLPGVPAGLAASEIESRGAGFTEAADFARDEVDPVMIVFTSGTTSEPRAVVHTWRSMMATLDTVAALINASDGDVVYAKELHLILPALFGGASVVMPSRSRMKAARTLSELHRFKVTHFFSVTGELQQVTDLAYAKQRYLPDSLREIWIGAAPVRASFLQRFESIVRHDPNIWCVYGMTEILPVARVSLREKLSYDGDGDYVGRCVDGVTARISDDGELLLRGANLFSNYFGRPACAELASGDLARIDEGRIILVGRKKDMIIRSDFNIYPELYEATIEQISGVRQCAMVGVYDEQLSDECVVLFVQPEPGTDDSFLEKRLRDELVNGKFRIDASAQPDRIRLMALPLAGRSSKVDKMRLRQIAKREILCESP
jgi:acyl-CoA synthetase (AMP-forming)/AMP-acid ligase II